MCPTQEREHCITLNKQWKEGGKGGENCLGEELPLLITLQVTLKAQARTPQTKRTWNSHASAYAKDRCLLENADALCY